MTSMRIAAALDLLGATSPVQRSEALDQLTMILQEVNWQLASLPGLSAEQLTQALQTRLTDSNWCVVPLPPPSARKLPEPALGI